MANKKLGAVIAGVVVLGGLVLGFMSVEKISAGYVGVIYSMQGGIEDTTLKQGWHIVSPTKKVTSYSVATEQAYLSKSTKEGSKDDSSFDVPTADGKTINVDMEYSFHFIEDKLPQTYTRFRGADGESIKDTFINAKMKSWSQEVSADFYVIDIYGSKRAELNNEVLKHVNEKFAPYGIAIDSVNFSRIGLDSATEQAIQQRVNAQQQLETVKIEKEKAQLEAEKAVIEAQGKAKVTAVNAQAEADANKLKSATLTDVLVRYSAIQKWNGSLPTVTGGSTPIINMSDIIKNEK